MDRRPGVPGRRYRQAGKAAASMVTTNSVLPVETFGDDPPELVHLTGSFQVLARVTVGDPDDRPTHLELCFDAGRVRGVGLKTGVRYQAKGAYRFLDDLKELSVPLKLVGAFELLRHGPGDPPPTRLLLVAPFRVTVQADGRVMASLEDPTLLPCPGG
jgi:hypothetical protein